MKTWMITGCSSGLGRSLAKAALEEGEPEDTRRLFQTSFGCYAASKCALEGLIDGLRAETAPLGIKVMTVEPGAFRTDFAGRSLTQSKTVIADYEETAGARRIGKDLSHGTQQGDPDKGAGLIIKAIEAEDTPFRLLLGSDAVRFADQTMENRCKEYDKWREFSCQPDYQEG